MAFSGKLTAANHADVLAKIKAFITGDPAVPGRDWTVARHDALEWGPATVFRNTSLSETEEVYVGLYAATYTDSVRRPRMQGLQSVRSRPTRRRRYGFS